MRGGGGAAELAHSVRLLDRAQRAVMIAGAGEPAARGAADHDGGDVAAAGVTAAVRTVGDGALVPGDDDDAATTTGVPAAAHHRRDKGLEPVVAGFDGIGAAVRVHVVALVRGDPYEVRWGTAVQVGHHVRLDVRDDVVLAFRGVVGDGQEVHERIGAG